MKNVLVIEDNDQNMYLIEFILKKHGYGVLKAINGQEGIKMAKESDFDLIIMDWQLPDIDGLEVTKRIKKIERLKEIPVIFCTSNVMKGDRERAVDAGADDYIEKPIRPESFIEVVKKFL